MSTALTDIEEEGIVNRINAHYVHRKRAEGCVLEDPVKAREHFELAVDELLGPLSARVPYSGVRWQPYIDMDARIRTHSMGCYVGIAQSLILQKQFEEALAWLEEVRVLHQNTRYTLKEPYFEGNKYNLDIPDLTLNRVTAQAYASDIFLSLGNTGSAADRRGNTGHLTLGKHHQTTALQAIFAPHTLMKIISLRHPDPTVTPKLEVTVPSLQVNGSWKKLSVKKRGGMKPRLGFSSFIWKNHLYVGGGGGSTKGPWYRDLWRLNLENLNKWEELPSYPHEPNQTGPWLNWEMMLFKGKAYLFTGRPDLDIFDHQTLKWSTVKSTCNPTKADIEAGVDASRQWPYYYFACSSSTQQVVGGKLYVFGGVHGKTLMGCNLFMELDLTTMKWRRVSGTTNAGLTADYSCPGSRRSPSSWVDRDQKYIYILGGECDRTAASMNNEPHSARMGYAYEDFWSWEIATEKWKPLRLAGNVPCPRSEAACSYNKKLDKAFVFGGYNPALMTNTENRVFEFTYYGDTFMFCPAEKRSDGGYTEPKWKHVLTRGFPTYRAMSQLHTDPDTGKIYLFGGYVNTDAVPTRKDYISRTFCDLWQLRVDLEGGSFEDVNLDEETKTAAVGPWQRCFACGSAGRWKKCGGSCGGKAFFCDSQCLLEGWKDHRKMHECKKV